MDNLATTCEMPTKLEESHRNGGDCTICSETRLLDAVLVGKVNQLFENRLQYVLKNGNNDRQKLLVYEDWVNHLRMINLDMVEAIKEMETTFQNRIPLLYQKIRTSLLHAEHDRNNLREFVRKALVTNQWDISGVQFYDASIYEIFDKSDGVPVQKQNSSNNDGPTIAVSLEVSSNCEIENIQIKELQRELDAKNRQITELELLLDQKIPGCPQGESSVFETESKDAKLRNVAVDNLRKESNMNKVKLEPSEVSSQLDVDINRTISELENLDAHDKLLLQRLQNYSQVKSEQYNALLKDNETLREQICTLKNQLVGHSNVDSQSLVNEIKDHYDNKRRLEKKLREYEQSLRKASSAVQHRDLVIDKLRQDIHELKKGSMTEARLNSKVVSSNETVLHSSESTTSFGSARSGSSIHSVIAAPAISSASIDTMRSSLDRLTKESKVETEQMQCLRNELDAMAEELERFQTLKQTQDDIIVEQNSRLNANDNELNELRKGYENNNKMLFLVRTEIVKLIKAVRESLKGQVSLPQNIKPVEEFVFPPYSISGTDLPAELFEQDKAVIGSLKQHMDAITTSYLLANAEKCEISKMFDNTKKELSALQKEKRRSEALIETLQKRSAPERAEEMEDKETSIDSDIESMSSGEIATETLAKQQLHMQEVLHGLAKEISYLIGKDLSDDSLSAFSDLDATPLHFLIEDLKKEIEAKDALLREKTDYTERLEQQISAKEKDLHRLQLRQQAAEEDRMSYCRKLENVQRALQDQEVVTISVKRKNGELEQKLDDMKEMLETYTNNNRALIDEKNYLEDECKNQLVTISNLRTALEETKRHGSTSVSFTSLRGGVAGPNHSGQGYNFQSQHVYRNSSKKY